MSRDAAERASVLEDLAYHQVRVLLLVDAVSRTDGHARKLDGLTKLAKLDFLVRYPALAPAVLDLLEDGDQRLGLEATTGSPTTDAEAPMTRYKYGPWDDRYYAIVGALVGRGLLRYTRGRRGSIALATTPAGRELVTTLADTPQWGQIRSRCEAVAEGSAGMTGNALKEAIYRKLPSLMDRPQRSVIR